MMHGNSNIKSIIKISMSMEHWWNNVDKEIEKYSHEKVFQGQFHHKKSYTNRPGIELVPP